MSIHLKGEAVGKFTDFENGIKADKKFNLIPINDFGPKSYYSSIKGLPTPKENYYDNNGNSENSLGNISSKFNA